MKAFNKLLALLLIATLAGCASEPERQELSEREIYETAQGYLNSKNFSLAIQNLQLLESRYPFGPYAEQAQL